MIMDALLVAEIDRLIKPWGCKVTGIGPDAVAVMGDARVYAASVIVQVPSDTDHEEIARISNAITNNVRGVARVMMNIEPIPLQA
jgi:GMP synthase PP-ATPase subunit